MVLLQIQTQLSKQPVHLLCVCDNDKPTKIPFKIFQVLPMLLASHIVHEIHSGDLMHSLQQRSCPRHEVPTKPQVRSKNILSLVRKLIKAMY